MTGFLLDTNALSDLVRDPAGPIARRIATEGEEAVCTSVIVAAELRYGARKRGSPRLTKRVEALLGELPVLPFEAPADAAYGEIRTALEAAGTPIGGNDMLIAAQARASDLVVVTANLREFMRVEGLRVENWLEPT